MDNTELMHYGRKGMKWGQHIFTSPENVSVKKNNSKNKTKNISKNKTKNETKKPVTKKLSDMSDDEIRTKIARLELEKKYKDLAKETMNSKSDKGRKFVEEVLTNSTKNIATQLVTYGLGTAVNKAGEKAGVKNAKVEFKDKDGKTVYGDDGLARMVDIFDGLVNPKKGQKDK